MALPERYWGVRIRADKIFCNEDNKPHHVLVEYISDKYWYLFCLDCRDEWIWIDRERYSRLAHEPRS